MLQPPWWSFSKLHILLRNWTMWMVFMLTTLEKKMYPITCIKLLQKISLYLNVLIHIKLILLYTFALKGLILKEMARHKISVRQQMWRSLHLLNHYHPSKWGFKEMKSKTSI